MQAVAYIRKNGVRTLVGFLEDSENPIYDAERMLEQQGYEELRDYLWISDGQHEYKAFLTKKEA